MTAPTIDAGQARDAKNPHERALWIVSCVLIVGSALAIVWVQDVFAANNQGWSQEPPVEIRIAQAIYSIAPSAMTGGFLLAGIALALGALRFDRKNAGTHPIPAPNPVASDGPAAMVVPPVAAGKSPTSPAPTDHTLYMRPQSGE